MYIKCISSVTVSATVLLLVVIPCNQKRANCCDIISSTAIWGIPGSTDKFYGKITKKGSSTLSVEVVEIK